MTKAPKHAGNRQRFDGRAISLETGTAVEVNGHVVAYIVPIRLRNGHPDEVVPDAKNDRRCDLIDKKSTTATRSPWKTKSSC